MDIKERLKKNKEHPQPLEEDNHFLRMDSYARPSGTSTKNLNKYMRRSSALQQKKQPKTIQKYCRVQSAPKEQFKRYLIDAQNVFYQDRESLAEIERFRMTRKVCTFLFLTLLVTYFLVGRINGYGKDCPSNAWCGAYVHCNIGYDFDPELDKCVISKKLIEESERLCQEKIRELQYLYGQQTCDGNPDQAPPTLHVDNILNNLQTKTESIVQKKILAFLEEEKNEKQFNFSYRSLQISPTIKKYSLNCQVKQIIGSSYFMIGMPLFWIGVCLVGWIYFKLKRKFKAKQIYREIRKKVLQQKMVNISHLKNDLQGKYGEINETLWEEIDNYRTYDKDIGYLHDDFLYWKLL